MNETLRHKTIILIGDGMGDLPVAELAGKTPLDHAETPAMDELARTGELALLKTVPDSLPPGSDVANLSLLGYCPEEFYSGRAPLEAASMGVKLGGDDIAFRCNLVTLDFADDGRVIMADYSAGHIDTPGARTLIEALARELDSRTLQFHAGVSYRHLLVLKNGPEDLLTEPPHDHTGQEVTGLWQDYLAGPLGKVVEQAGEILKGHPFNQSRLKAGLPPANAVWLWGQGRAPAIRTLGERYGLKGSLISAVDLLRGIGIYAGLEVIRVSGATGYLDTNYAGKVQAALAAVRHDDLVVVHVEAPDETAHQGSLSDKIKAIEDFDQLVVQPVFEGLKALGGDFQLVVAMDHLTPVSTRTHDRKPVPVIIHDGGENFRPSGLRYCENNGDKTGIYYRNGAELFKRLVI